MSRASVVRRNGPPFHQPSHVRPERFSSQLLYPKNLPTTHEAFPILGIFPSRIFLQKNNNLLLFLFAFVRLCHSFSAVVIRNSIPSFFTQASSIHLRMSESRNETPFNLKYQSSGYLLSLFRMENFCELTFLNNGKMLVGGLEVYETQREADVTSGRNVKNGRWSWDGRQLLLTRFLFLRSPTRRRRNKEQRRPSTSQSSWSFDTCSIGNGNYFPSIMLIYFVPDAVLIHHLGALCSGLESEE